MTVICTVGPGSIDVMVDGRTIVHWTGPSDHFSLEPGIAADVGNGLALVSSSQFRFPRIELVPLSGDGANPWSARDDRRRRQSGGWAAAHGAGRRQPGRRPCLRRRPCNAWP